ncbi:MAG: hypothetical protein CM1200mP2_22270 [Planctomycetaceae bacterium]|nr:MAG: hypothetical protein CM1200mP2_22270 [Planctomycetaceae bacterium]
MSAVGVVGETIQGELVKRPPWSWREEVESRPVRCDQAVFLELEGVAGLVPADALRV